MFLRTLPGCPTTHMATGDSQCMRAEIWPHAADFIPGAAQRSVMCADGSESCGFRTELKNDAWKINIVTDNGAPTGVCEWRGTRVRMRKKCGFSAAGRPGKNHADLFPEVPIEKKNGGDRVSRNGGRRQTSPREPDDFRRGKEQGRESQRVVEKHRPSKKNKNRTARKLVGVIPPPASAGRKTDQVSSSAHKARCVEGRSSNRARKRRGEISKTRFQGVLCCKGAVFPTRVFLGQKTATLADDKKRKKRWFRPPGVVLRTRGGPAKTLGAGAAKKKQDLSSRSLLLLLICTGREDT